MSGKNFSSVAQSQLIPNVSSVNPEIEKLEMEMYQKLQKYEEEKIDEYTEK